MAAQSLCRSSFLVNTYPFSHSRVGVSASARVGLPYCYYNHHRHSTSTASSSWNVALVSRSRRSGFPVVQVVASDAAQQTEGLTLNLKVEGTIADSLIPKVTDALKKFEGISDLKVYTSEGVATVELAKLTTIQATGEASSLLEAIQGEGFKMQNLSISFNDPAADADEDIAYEYETSS